MFSKIFIEQHEFIIGSDKVKIIKKILTDLGFSMKDSLGEVEVWIK